MLWGRISSLVETFFWNALSWCQDYFCGKELPFLRYDSVITWKMIDFLVRLHAGKHILFDMIISPTQIKIKVTNWFCEHVPLVFLGHVFHNSILCVYIRVNDTCYIDNDFIFFIGMLVFICSTLDVISESSVEGVLEFLHIIS